MSDKCLEQRTHLPPQNIHPKAGSHRHTRFQIDCQLGMNCVPDPAFSFPFFGISIMVKYNNLSKLPLVGKINLFHRLISVDAYQMGLFKQIAVSSNQIAGGNQAYVRLHSVSNDKGLKVKVELDVNGKAIGGVDENIVKKAQIWRTIETYLDKELRVGWDNLNVFQVCTLIEQKSTFICCQKIGCGLRLCVNQAGERIEDKNMNALHVMANASFSEFAATLQKEIEDKSGGKFSVLQLSLFSGMVYETHRDVEKQVTTEQAQAVVEVLKTAGVVNEAGQVSARSSPRKLNCPRL